MAKVSRKPEGAEEIERFQWGGRTAERRKGEAWVGALSSSSAFAGSRFVPSRAGAQRSLINPRERSQVLLLQRINMASP
jgi:hypothetical protein